MAENEKDGGQSAGTAGTPTQQGSSGNGDSNSSIDAAKLATLIEGFGKRIEEIDARTKSLQGDKDRAVIKTKKEVEELKAKIAEYEKLKSKGLEPDEALDEMDFRSTVRQLQEQLKSLGSVPASPAGNGGNVTGDAAQVLHDYQLSANDPDVMSKLNLTGSEFRAAMADLAFRRATKPQPDASVSTTILGTPPPPEKPVEVEAITAEQQRLMKNPSANYKRLAEIRELLKA